jgi:hypothetical protein
MTIPRRRRGHESEEQMTDHEPTGAEFDPMNQHPAQPAMDRAEEMWHLKGDIQRAMGIDRPRWWNWRLRPAWRAMRDRAIALDVAIRFATTAATIDPGLESRELRAMMERCR